MTPENFLDLPPLLSAKGTVRLPGSKSISNRVLLLAALSEGTTEVRDLLHSDASIRRARISITKCRFQRSFLISTTS